MFQSTSNALGTATKPNAIFGLNRVRSAAHTATVATKRGETQSGPVYAAGDLVAAFARSPLFGALCDAVDANVHEVMAERPIFERARYANPSAYVQRLTLFALLSPRLAFGQNVNLCRRVFDALPNIATLDDLYSVFYVQSARGDLVRFNGWKTKATNVLDALPIIRNLTPQTATAETLQSIRGVGPKVAAFGAHLVDWDANVFTLDVHILRTVAAIAGLEYAVDWRITNAAYRQIEPALVALFRSRFPTLPLFAVQWCIWDLAFGFHQSHAPILGEHAATS